MDHVQVVERFLAAVSDPATPDDELVSLLHPEYVFQEWPNAISPSGSERDRASSLRSIAASRALLSQQRFEVHGHVVSDDVVASRITWRGRLAADAGPLPAGAELVAHISQHTTLRDGRIWRTESFDCYEPLPARQ